MRLSQILKILGIVIVLIPAFLLILYAFQTVENNFVYIILSVPFLILAMIAWQNSFRGGLAILAVGIFLVIVTPAKTVEVNLINLTLGQIAIYAPPLIAGFLFIVSSKFKD